MYVYEGSSSLRSREGVIVQMLATLQTSFVSLKADVGCNTEKSVLDQNNSPSPPAASLSSDEDQDCDVSKDYVPSASEESEREGKSLSLIVTRDYIGNNPMRCIGYKEHLDTVKLLSNTISYRKREQLMTKTDVL